MARSPVSTSSTLYVSTQRCDGLPYRSSHVTSPRPWEWCQDAPGLQRLDLNRNWTMIDEGGAKGRTQCTAHTVHLPSVHC